MIVLGLDSALDACSAALWRDGTVLSRVVVPGARDQAENLVPIVLKAMKDAGVDWSDIDRIAVTVGPGSFTGLRIGLAAARGFALAANRPALGVTTFAALAAHLKPGRPIGVAIDAGRGDVFFQAFDSSGSPIGEPASRSADEAVSLLPQGARVVGSAALALKARTACRDDLDFPDVPQYPDPVAVAALGAAAPAPKKDALPAPLYIHPPRIKLPAQP